MTDQTPASTALSELVRTRRAELGLSLRTVEQLSTPDSDQEGKPLIRFGWLNRLEQATERFTPPTYHELEALARVLKLSLHALQDAAGQQFFGIQQVWISPEVRTFAEVGEQLTQEQREMILRIAQEMITKPSQQ